jgi:hypothetical protein
LQVGGHLGLHRKTLSQRTTTKRVSMPFSVDPEKGILVTQDWLHNL